MKENKKKMQVWISNDLKNRIDQYCLKNETTFSQRTRDFWLEEIKKEEK